jgi:hypothetical protein
MARIPPLLTWIVLTGWVIAQQRTPALPAELSDQDFWQLIVDISEPDGHFEDENFVSNETGYQRVMQRLQEAVQPGGVYVGVGPEQNFSYIAGMRPAMAFIIDIRRENRSLHLFYKALFELSTDRADFVSRLFSRWRPAGLTSSAGVEEIFARYDGVAAYAQRTPQADLRSMPLLPSRRAATGQSRGREAPPPGSPRTGAHGDARPVLVDAVGWRPEQIPSVTTL